MNKYECLYIIENELSDEAKEGLVEKFKGLIEGMKGKVENIDKWGAKKYAYTINFKNEGYYVLMNFEGDATIPAELERQMNITDGIVRKMVIRKE
jgi:small subunit ribosomal protein S6